MDAEPLSTGKIPACPLNLRLKGCGVLACLQLNDDRCGDAQKSNDIGGHSRFYEKKSGRKKEKSIIETGSPEQVPDDSRSQADDTDEGREYRQDDVG